MRRSGSSASNGADLTAALRDAAGGDVDVVIDPLWGEPAAARSARSAAAGG